MANMTAPLDELSTAHLVVLEAPPNVAARFEHDMLSLVSRIMAQGPEVAVMVQPSLRRKSNKTLWVHRWNRLTRAPFKLRQTCSCKASNNVPGCHLTCLIGATTAIDMSPCAEVPTLSATPLACVESLGGLLYSLCSCLLPAEGDGEQRYRRRRRQRDGKAAVRWSLQRRQEWPRLQAVVRPSLMAIPRHLGRLEGLVGQGLNKHQTQL